MTDSGSSRPRAVSRVPHWDDRWTPTRRRHLTGTRVVSHTDSTVARQKGDTDRQPRDRYGHSSRPKRSRI